MDIYLVRHTRLKSVEGLCYGRAEVTLGPDFPEAAAAVKSKLAATDRARIFSSPAQRCRALAEFLRPAHTISPDNFTIASELQELDFGLWEMRSWESIPRGEIDRWADDYLNIACPEGESLQDMRNRVLPFWDATIRSGIADVILITHAGPIRIILSHLMGISERDIFSIPVGFGSVSKIKFTAEKVEIISVNQ